MLPSHTAKWQEHTAEKKEWERETIASFPLYDESLARVGISKTNSTRSQSGFFPRPCSLQRAGHPPGLFRVHFDHHSPTQHQNPGPACPYNNNGIWLKKMKRQPPSPVPRPAALAINQQETWPRPTHRSDTSLSRTPDPWLPSGIYCRWQPSKGTHWS